MDWRRYSDPKRFLDDARPLLAVDVARNQVLLSVAEIAAEQSDVYPVFHGFVVFGEGPVAVATQTPPHNFLLSEAMIPAAIQVLVAAIRGSGLEVPGILGNEPDVGDFARSWAQASRVEPEVETRQGVFALEEVSDLALASGSLRRARPGDRDLLIRWWEEFQAEALPGTRVMARKTEDRVDNLLEPGRSQGMHVWEVDGEVVSMSGFSPPVANAIRIGPVYTPPALRGKGYATALVASQSREFLESGLERCLLHTDLGNPTSNAIYKRIGYHQVAEAAEYRFSR